MFSTARHTEGIYVMEISHKASDTAPTNFSLVRIQLVGHGKDPLLEEHFGEFRFSDTVNTNQKGFRPYLYAETYGEPTRRHHILTRVCLEKGKENLDVREWLGNHGLSIWWCSRRNEWRFMTGINSGYDSGGSGTVVHGAEQVFALLREWHDVVMGGKLEQDPPPPWRK